MSLLDTVRFLENDSRTTLSKYRGQPWSIELSEAGRDSHYYTERYAVMQVWCITDKATGRQLTTAFRGKPHAKKDQSAINITKGGTVFERYLYVSDTNQKTLQEFETLDELAKDAWHKSVPRFYRAVWHVLAFSVRIADAISAIAKLAIKVGLAGLSIYVIWPVIENQAPMIPEAISWLIDLVEPIEETKP